MAKLRLLPEGMSIDDLSSDHGFDRPAKLSGIITKVEFFDAQSGTGRYCRIGVKKDEFLVRAQAAIAAGLPENAQPNQYYLEAGSSLMIRRK